MAMAIWKREYVFLAIYFGVLSITPVQSISSEPQAYCVLDPDGGTVCRANNNWKVTKYILYDVNPPEGFNLRRDVYLRMVILLKKLEPLGNWKLVLPPWPKLYHWQSTDIGSQDMLPWGLFFDITSLKKFAPVIEMSEYFTEIGNSKIDQVYYLQHPKELLEDEDFDYKFRSETCPDNLPYTRDGKDNSWTGKFWGYSNITAETVKCYAFHGQVPLLVKILRNMQERIIMLDHAEIVLHDTFGDQVYWYARRSMRFAWHLVDIAADFRTDAFGTDDENDGTEMPEDWRMEKPGNEASGGPYLCVHLRRKDFVWAKPKEVPSLRGAAQQISDLLEDLRLDTVYLATDAPKQEVLELKTYLRHYNIVRYKPPAHVRELYKDGGVAIIEQIICSHARHFIGTYESTYSFRIQEEREIMGFHPDSTYNRLCGDGVKNCSRPAEWKVVY